MKVCIITYGDYYYSTILKNFILSKREYCDIHKYSFIHVKLKEQNIFKYGWYKIEILLKYFNYYDVIYITDMDSVIINNDISITNIMSGFKNPDIILSSLNTGYKLLGGSIWINNSNTLNILNLIFSHEFDNEYRAEENVFNKIISDKYNICINNTVNAIHDIHDIPMPLLKHYAGILNPITIRKLHEETYSKK